MSTWLIIGIFVFFGLGIYLFIRKMKIDKQAKEDKAWQANNDTQHLRAKWNQPLF